MSSRDLGKVLGGTVARNGLRGLFKMTLPIFLPPQALGVLRVSYGLFRITASLAGLGLDYAIVTFVAGAKRRGDTAEADGVLKATLIAKGLVALLVAVVGWFAAPSIARAVLGDPALTGFVRMALVAVGGQLLWKFVSSWFSAHEQFGKLAAFLMAVPLLAWAQTLVLLALGRFDLPSVIAIHLFTPLVAAAFGWLAIDRAFLRGVVGRPLLVRVLRFSRWVYAANVASSARSHLNPILLKNPALSGSLAQGELNAGLYSFGNDLANEVSLFSQSLFTVLLPKATGRGRQELLRFFRRSYVQIAALLALLVPAAWLAGPALRGLSILFPAYAEYLPALPVFYLLYFGALVTIPAIPARAVLYAIERPQFGTYLEIASTVVLVVGGFLAIPRFGTVGAAAVVLLIRVVSFLALLLYAWIQLRRFEPEST